MIRNFKALGLAMVAVFAMSAIAASAAQAEGVGSLTAPSYTATLTSEQVGNNVFKIGTGVREVECSTTTYKGSLAAASTSVTLEPTYTGCTAKPGAIPATVKTNGCDFDLTATKTPQNLNGTVKCPAGAKIEVFIYENATKHAEGKALCAYSIAAQGPIAAGTWKNVATGVEASLSSKPATTVVTGTKILCGAAAGSSVESTLSGTQILKASTGTLMIG